MDGRSLHTYGPSANAVAAYGGEFARARASLDERRAIVERLSLQDERADLLALLTEIGSRLGRLHALAHDTWAAAIDTVGLNPAGEVAYALHCLAQVEGRVPPERSVEHRRLVAQLEQIPSFSDCPETLIHGDCHLGNLERRCAPDYYPSERFWGATYDDWVRQAERADWLAQLALAQME